MAGALIVTAELGDRDLAWLDRLRRSHFPPERNRLKAHLTMFHALPPSAEQEARAGLKSFSGGPPPRASIEGLMNLGGGVAFRVVSEGLDRIRESLAEMFRGLLSAQDSGGWRPHITIQNKVNASQARQLLMRLEQEFRPCELAVHGLGLHRYLGGPWEDVARYPFRGN
jgi:hypothetical protein